METSSEKLSDMSKVKHQVFISKTAAWFCLCSTSRICLSSPSSSSFLLRSSHDFEIALLFYSSLSLNKTVQFSSDFSRSDIHSYFNVYTVNIWVPSLQWAGSGDTRLKKTDALDAYTQVGDTSMQGGKCGLWWEHKAGAHDTLLLRKWHLNPETEG